VLYRLSYMSINFLCRQYLERVAGIEPAYSAWKADVLPMNYTRLSPLPIEHQPCRASKKFQRLQQQPKHTLPSHNLYFDSLQTALITPRRRPSQHTKPVRLTSIGAGGWIRTTEAFASELQSDPFGHSGTPAEKGWTLSTPSA
jgi:hypothetical protein